MCGRMQQQCTLIDLKDCSKDRHSNLQQSFDRYIEYNEFNQVVRVRETDHNGQILEEYTYDENGNRITKYEPQLDQTTYYISEDFIEVVNATGSYLTTYYHEGLTLVARQDSNGETFFYHPDHLGSTDTVTNSSGNVVEETTYKPYGETIDGGDSTFLYNSKELDTNTNMYYYGARYYDPFFRRFTQPDQNIPELYNPQDLNRYSYVRNNPYKYVDPTGEIAIPAIIYTIAETTIDIASLAYSLHFVVKNPESTAYQLAALADVADLAYGPFSNPGPSGYTILNGAEFKKFLLDKGKTFFAVTGLRATEELKDSDSTDKKTQQQFLEANKNEGVENDEVVTRKRQRFGMLKPREGISSTAIGNGFEGSNAEERIRIRHAMGVDCGESCAKAAMVRQGRLGSVNEIRAKLIEQGRG